MIRKTAKTWLAMVLLTASGCTAIQDHCINYETKARNCVLVEKGWLNWRSCYNDLDNKLDFAKGFKEGYTNILEGGKGCQPTLPPRWYWKPCYQTPAGRCRIAAWFDGFTHGAVAAQHDGFGNLQQLPISPTARANWMTRQAPPSAACFAGMSSEPLADPGHHPDIHGENAPEDPPIDMLMPPEPGDGGEKLVPAKPYDDSLVPAVK